MLTEASHILADAALKSSIVLLAAWGLSLMLGKAPAAARHLVWTCAACGLLLLPALSYLSPAWDLPVSTVTVSGDGPVFRVKAVGLADLPRLALGEAVSAGSVAEGTGQPAAPARRDGWVFVLWAAGAALSVMPLALGMVAVWWRRRSSTLLPENTWGVLDLARTLGIRRRVRVFVSDRAAMPMTTGALRPAIMLPAQAEDWTPERRRMVLLHELAHVQRRDCLTQCLARLACGLYWFHPLAWFAVRQAMRERERACDDLVLRAGTRASDYAGELLEVARSMIASRLAWGAVAMARPAQLEGRLLAILDARVRRGNLTRAGALSAAVLSALALLPIAAIRPVQAQVAGVKAVLPADPAPEQTAAAYRSAAEAQKAAHGADSIEYATALLRAARYMREHDEYRQAQDLFATALPIYERVYGPARVEMADVYESMGNAALSRQNDGKAGEFYARALDLYTRTGGERGAAVARLLALIGQKEVFDGKLQDAEGHFIRALAANGAESPDRALALEMYAQMLRKAQRTAEAEKLEADALAIRSKAVQAYFGSWSDPAAKVGGEVSVPVPISKSEPRYSEQAWAAKYQGKAVYGVVIGPDGTVRAATLKHSIGLGLDEQGAEAIRHWKFKPATRDGLPVAVHATIEINFRLM